MISMAIGPGIQQQIRTINSMWGQTLTTPALIQVLNHFHCATPEEACEKSKIFRGMLEPGHTFIVIGCALLVAREADIVSGSYLVIP